ncbi:MAG: glycine--tRNA ligase subunit beta, partial [Terriglobia bacterium]
MSEITSFLIEIGCEEIPARFLEGAERDLSERLRTALGAALLCSQDSMAVRTNSTPRRLVAYVPELWSKQQDRVEEVIGPPVKAAFDKEGKPTRAAESFAAKNNAKVSDLKRVTTAKGEYLALEVSKAGKPALQVLVEVLPSVLASMTFPKNMYWTAKAGPLFVRPIRWILALLGDGSDFEVIPFEFAGVKSGNLTYGHRFEGNRPLAITDLNLDLFLDDHFFFVHGAE